MLHVVPPQQLGLGYCCYFEDRWEGCYCCCCLQAGWHRCPPAHREGKNGDLCRQGREAAQQLKRKTQHPTKVLTYPDLFYGRTVIKVFIRKFK